MVLSPLRAELCTELCRHIQLLLFLTHSSIKRADRAAGNQSSPESVAVAYGMRINLQPLGQPSLGTVSGCRARALSSIGQGLDVQARAHSVSEHRHMSRDRSPRVAQVKAVLKKKHFYDLPYPRQQQYGLICL